jgi:hypothetical protein
VVLDRARTDVELRGDLTVRAATVTFTHTKTLLASGHSPAQAATSGCALGFWVITGISAASVVAWLALVRGRELEQPSPAVAL